MEKVPMTLTSDNSARIELLHQVAKENGSMVSIKELVRLLPERTSEEELLEAIVSLPSLTTRFELKGGYVTERFESGIDVSEREAEGRKRAGTNMKHAARLVSYLGSNPFHMIAVSGSTSYGSASRSRDLDLFCVSPPKKMWLSLTLGLIISRIYRLSNRDSPNVCLSCIMDRDYAYSAFSYERGALFARDAIETKVMKGRGEYLSLLNAAGWISKYYPLAYEASNVVPSSTKEILRASVFDRFLNSLLFLTVGKYLGIKSAVLNRKLAAGGRAADLFDVLVGEDHLIYESRRYSALRREYDEVLPVEAVRQVR